jgi:hypothetical protein
MRGLLLILKLAAAVALVAGTAQFARADEIDVREARLELADEGIALSADFSFDFNHRLEQTVANGVPLYFLVEFELTRPRWYWFDEKAATRRQHIRLSYHAISRQYRLSTGLLQQSFASIDEALAVLRRLRNWLVLERGTPLADVDYVAAVRLHLDLSLLPKPFQVSALTSRELRLESDWWRFGFRPPAVFLAQPAGPERTDHERAGQDRAGPDRVPDKPDAADRGAAPAVPVEVSPR